MKDVKLLKTNDDNCEYLNATYYLENTYYTDYHIKSIYDIYVASILKVASFTLFSEQVYGLQKY